MQTLRRIVEIVLQGVAEGMDDAVWRKQQEREGELLFTEPQSGSRQLESMYGPPPTFNLQSFKKAAKGKGMLPTTTWLFCSVIRSMPMPGSRR